MPKEKKIKQKTRTSNSNKLRTKKQKVYCSGCGKSLAKDENFCSKCGTKRIIDKPQNLSETKAKNGVIGPKNPWTACFFNLLILGAGFWYLGKWGKGFLFLLFGVLAYAIAGNVGMIIAYIGAMTISYQDAKKYNLGQAKPKGSETSKLVAIFFLMIIGIIFLNSVFKEMASLSSDAQGLSQDDNQMVASPITYTTSEAVQFTKAEQSQDTKKSEIIPAVTASAVVTPKTSCGGIPPNKIPEVQLFVTSESHSSLQMEDSMIGLLDLLGDKIDFKLRFLYRTRNGQEEVEEQVRQYCIQKTQSTKFLDYLSTYVGLRNSEESINLAGVDRDKLDSCTKVVYRQFSVTERYPLFDVDKELNEKYGVEDEPTLVINDKVLDTEKGDPASLLKTVCCAFEEPPVECEKELSDSEPIISPKTNTDTAIQKDDIAEDASIESTTVNTISQEEIQDETQQVSTIQDTQNEIGDPYGNSIVYDYDDYANNLDSLEELYSNLEKTTSTYSKIEECAKACTGELYYQYPSVKYEYIAKCLETYNYGGAQYGDYALELLTSACKKNVEQVPETESPSQFDELEETLRVEKKVDECVKICFGEYSDIPEVQSELHSTCYEMYYKGGEQFLDEYIEDCNK